jgi:thiamine biosynthesis lipoprotein
MILRHHAPSSSSLVLLPLLVAAAILLEACSPAAPQEYQRTIYAFGTLIQLTLYGVEPHRAKQLGDRVEKELLGMHARWHAWKPSEVTRLNAAFARGEPFRVTPDVADLIRLSKEAYKTSGGRFNPAAGHLFALWGFQTDIPPEGPPPTPQQVAAVVAEHATMDDVTLDGDWVRSRNPHVALDFGGIAKGYAGQLILKELRAQGVKNAILNAGGGLQAMGRHGDRPWRIGIRSPKGSGVLGALEVGPEEEGLHTSGNYERYREYAGKRYQHIIDVRTGMPAQHIVSTTVINPNGALADAAATALVIAGPQHWQEVAKAMGIRLALLVDDQGTLYMTPPMRARVVLEQPPTKIVIRN